MLIRYRNRIARQIVNGILGAYTIAIMIMGMQGMHHQVSFTTATFLFPVFAILYLIHSNPYDIEIGAVNVGAFEDMITYSYTHKRDILLMSLFMHDFEGSGKKYPVEIQNTIRHFYSDFFKGAVLFQITNGRMILVVDLAKNPAYENSVNHMLSNFSMEYPKYKLDFKINITKSVDAISEINDYVGLIKYIESGMKENDVHYIDEKDIEQYFEYKYILTQLEDINRKKDLNDPRVEVYCQPVLNIITGKYDTAEALMRLRLEKIGMVYPDRFIPVAEENGYIHTLSKIILNKTCEHIKAMLDCTYIVKRISVNFAVSEVRDESFCKDINDIIEKSGIPYEKIAIEITESQNENDFLVMKEKINELRDHGIKFYLDDFGTGYSNFERIMELPFDIIKFDRSMVIASAMDYKSQKMVYYLAKMFSDMNYSVLYEGVETIEDEEKCKKMCANYLQGYKYSKPIPIEQLTEYFEKESA
ncbi:MAG: EAL domain-containing protein [Lachnospiraceae bacterium]|nr:EAL domain-containing protein [Lachnospiraceae bacterium]